MAKKMDIPEYYSRLQKKRDSETPEQPTATPEQPTAARAQAPPQGPPADIVSSYSTNSFSLQKLDDWVDKTVYVLTGPVENGIQHNVVINMEEDVSFDSVIEYAVWQISTLESELKGCRLLKKGKRQLTNGLDAYEAVFRWYPSDDLRVYQHQIYVLAGRTGYKLTATFTKKTRRTLGPKVERMMLSFEPA